MVFNGCRSVWSSCLSWELHVSVWSESGGHQSGVMWRPQTMGDQCPEQDWPLLTSPAGLTISISKWRLQFTAQTCLCFGFQTGFTRQWFSQSGGDWKAVIMSCNHYQLKWKTIIVWRMMNCVDTGWQSLVRGHRSTLIQRQWSWSDNSLIPISSSQPVVVKQILTDCPSLKLKLSPHYVNPGKTIDSDKDLYSVNKAVFCSNKLSPLHPHIFPRHSSACKFSFLMQIENETASGQHFYSWL